MATNSLNLRLLFSDVFIIIVVVVNVIPIAFTLIIS